MMQYFDHVRETHGVNRFMEAQGWLSHPACFTSVGEACYIFRHPDEATGVSIHLSSLSGQIGDDRAKVLQDYLTDRQMFLFPIQKQFWNITDIDLLGICLDRCRALFQEIRLKNQPDEDTGLLLDLSGLGIPANLLTGPSVTSSWEHVQ